MNDTAINSVRYTGTVTLSQYIGQKKVIKAKLQNSGEAPLFNFLSDCLLGDFDIARLTRPNKVMLLKRIPERKDTDGSIIPAHYERRSPMVAVLSKPEKVLSTLTGSIVRYSFSIPSDMIDDDYDSIGLYTHSTDISDFENFAAVANNIPKSNITDSAALIVDWELQISNK